MNQGEPFVSHPQDAAEGPRPPHAAIGPGTRIGPFTIDAQIGQGGMATVYRARQTEPHRFVALKVIRADHAVDATYRRRFLDEAETLAALEHPSIVPIYAAGEADGVLYIAMRLADGPDLQARITSYGRLTLVETIRVLEPIADAIDYAHAMGVVHRDLKPSNIVIDRAGRPYLTDLGVGTRVESSPPPATPTVTLGTLDYMAPEQFTTAADPALATAADLYALGCVAYACLTGRPPFERTARDNLALAVADEAVPSVRRLLPEYPQQLDQVLARALAKDPRARFTSARAFMTALADVLRPPAVIEPRRATIPAAPPAAPQAAPPIAPPQAASRPSASPQAVPSPTARPSAVPPLAASAPRKARSRRAGLRAIALRAAALAVVATVAVAVGAVLSPRGDATDAETSTRPPATAAPATTPRAAQAPAFPNADETRLLALLPAQVDAGGCERVDDKNANAVAMIGCARPEGERKRVFFALYPDASTMTEDYAVLMRRLDLAEETKSTCFDLTRSNHTWRYTDDGFFAQQQGSMACYPRTETGFDGIQYVWTHDELNVMGFWLAPDYQTGLDYVEGWVTAARP